jgi:hypothetical protein
MGTMFLEMWIQDNSLTIFYFFNSYRSMVSLAPKGPLVPMEDKPVLGCVV